MSLAKQLIRANQTDKVSTTKFWYNIACGVSTLIVLWYAANLVLDFEMMLAYLGLVGGFSAYSKYLMRRGEMPISNQDSQFDGPGTGGY